MIIVLVVAAAGTAVGLALAYGSLRVVLGFIQSTIRELVARQRERRAAARAGAVERRASA